MDAFEAISDEDTSDIGSASEWASVSEEELDTEAAEPVLASSTSDWSGMVVPDLKKACKRLGLKVSGKKAELIERLEQHSAACRSAGPAGAFKASVAPLAEPSESSSNGAQKDAAGGRAVFETCTIAELKAALKSAGQKVTGKKAELVERCIENNVPVLSGHE
jgi:hypothetical protein